MTDKFDARRAALELVTAFVNNNRLTAEELPVLVRNIFNEVSAFGTDDKADGGNKAPADLPREGAQAAAAAQETPAEGAEAETAAVPALAVTVKESLANPDFIVSLITGEKLKTLKRHLRQHGFTPDQYRERYGLAADYPLVAPAYSQLRRAVARQMGLGRRSGPEAAASKETAPAKGKAVSGGAAGKAAGKAPRPRKAATQPAKAASAVATASGKAEARKARTDKVAGKPNGSELPSPSAAPKEKPAKARQAKPAASVKAKAAKPGKDGEGIAKSGANAGAKRSTLSPVFGE